MNIEIMLVPDFFRPKWKEDADYIYLILQPYLIQRTGEELLAYIKGFNFPEAEEDTISRPNITLRLFKSTLDLNGQGEGADFLIRNLEEDDEDDIELEYIPVPLPDTIQLTLSLVNKKNDTNASVFTLPTRDYSTFSKVISHSGFIKANKIYPQKFSISRKASDYYDEFKDYKLNLGRFDSTDDLLDEGSNLVLVAKINNDFYHVRIFDQAGNMFLDKGQGEFLPDESLFEQLDEALESQTINEQLESELIGKIISSLGYSQLIPYYWWKPDDERFPLPYQPENYDGEATFSQMLFHQMQLVASNPSQKEASGDRTEGSKLEVQLRIAFMFGKLLRIYGEEGQPLFTQSQRSEIMHVPNLLPDESQDDISNEIKERWYTNVHSLCGLVFPLATKQQIEDLPDDLFSENPYPDLRIKLDLAVPNNNQQVTFAPGEETTVSFPDENDGISDDKNPIRKIFFDLRDNKRPSEPSIKVSYPENIPNPTDLIFVLNKGRNLNFDAELTRVKDPSQDSYFSYLPEQDRDSDPEKRGSHQKLPLNLLDWKDYTSVSILTSSVEDRNQEDNIKCEFKIAIPGRFRPYRQFEDANKQSQADEDSPSRYLLIFEPEQRLPPKVIDTLREKLSSDSDDIELFAFGWKTPEENNVHDYDNFPVPQIKNKLVHFDRDEEENENSFRPVFFFEELELDLFNALSTRAKFLFTVSQKPIEGEWQGELNPELKEKDLEDEDRRLNFLWRSAPKGDPEKEIEIEFNVLSVNIPDNRDDSRELAVVLYYEKEFDFHLACSARHLWLPIIAKYDAINELWLQNDSEGSLAEMVAVDGWNHKELNVYFKDVENLNQFQYLNPQSMLLPTSESDPLPANNNNDYIERHYLFSTLQEIEDEKKPNPFPLPTRPEETQYTLAYPNWPRDYEPLIPPRISQLTKSQNKLIVSLGFEHQYGTQIFGKEEQGEGIWGMTFKPYLDWIFTDPTIIKKSAQKVPFSISTPTKFEKALIARNIVKIKQEFLNNNITLSEDFQRDNIQTQELNKEWIISNPGEEIPYIVRKEYGEINLYRDESFFLTFSIPEPLNEENSKLRLLVKGSWINNDADNNSREPDPLAVETRKAHLEFELSDSVCLLINGYVFDWRYDEDEVDGSGHDRNFSQKLKPVYYQKRIKFSDYNLEALLAILDEARDDFIEIDLAEKIHNNVSLLECQLELQRPQNLLFPIVSSFQLWRALDGEKVAPIYYKAKINSVNFSPNRSLIITSGNDKTAKVWDFQGQEVLVLNHPTEVTNAQFNSSGLRIITTAMGDPMGDISPAVYVWNLQGSQLHTLLHASEIIDVQLSSNSTYFLTIASNDQNVYLWNLQGQKTLLNHPSTVTSAQFSPDGERILTIASEDIEARLWNLREGQQDEPTLLPHPSAVTNAQFSPDGERILTIASEDVEARLWNLQGEQLATLTHPSAVTSAQFSPDGDRIISTVIDENGDNNAAKKWIWNTLSGTELAQINHKAEIEIVGFSPDSQIIVTASSDATTDKNDRLKLLRPKLGNQGTFMVPDSDLLNSEWNESFEDVSEKLEVRQALLGHLRSLHLFRNYLTPSYSNIEVDPSSQRKRDLAYRRNLNLLTTRSYAMAPEGFLRDEVTEIRHAIVPLAFLPLAQDPTFFESTQEIFRLLLEVLSAYEQLRLNEFNSDAFRDVQAWKDFFENNNGRLPIKGLREAIASSIQPIPRNDLEVSPNNLAENLADQWRTNRKDTILDWPQQYIFNLLKNDLGIYAESKALLVHALKDRKDPSNNKDFINLEKFPSYFYKLEVAKDVTEQDINAQTLSPLSIDIDTFTYQQTTTYKPQEAKLASLLIGDVLDDLTYDNEFSVDRIRYFSGEEFIESLSQEFIFEIKATKILDGDDDGGYDLEQIMRSLNQGVIDRNVPDDIKRIFQDYGQRLSENSFLILPLNFIFEINESRDEIDTYIEELNEGQITEVFESFFNQYYIQLSDNLSVTTSMLSEEWQIVDNEDVNEQDLKRNFIIYKTIYVVGNDDNEREEIKLEIYERDRERFNSEWWIRCPENDKIFIITVAEINEVDDGNTEITRLGVDVILIEEERPKSFIRLKDNVIDIPQLGKKSPDKDALVKLIARRAPSQALIVFQGIIERKGLSDRQFGDREYRCQLRDSSEFSRTERDNSENPPQIIGIREDGSGVVQSLRYPDCLWTKEAALIDCDTQGGAFLEPLPLCLPSLDNISSETIKDANPDEKSDSKLAEFIRTPKVLCQNWRQELQLNVVIVSLLIAVSADEEGQLQRDRLLIRRRPSVGNSQDEDESPKTLPPFTIPEDQDDQDDIKELRENGARAVSIDRLQQWLEPEQPQDPNLNKQNLVDWMSELVQRNLTLKEPEGEKWSDGYITFTRLDEEEDSDNNQKPILDKIELPERMDVTINSMRVSLFRPIPKLDKEQSKLHLVGIEVPVIAGEQFSTIGFRLVRNDEEDFDPRFIQFSRPAQRPAPFTASKIENFKGRLPDSRFLLIPTEPTNGWSLEDLFIELAKSILGPDESDPKNLYKEPEKLYGSIVRVSIYHVDDNPSPRLGFTQRDGALTVGKRLIKETGYKRPFSEAKLLFRFNEPPNNQNNPKIYLLEEHLLYWINIKCFTKDNVPFLELLNIPAKPDIQT